MDVTLSVVDDTSGHGLTTLREWLEHEPELRGRIEPVYQSAAPNELGALTDVLFIALGSGLLSTLLASVRTFLTQPGSSEFRITIQVDRGRIVEIAAKRGADVEALVHRILAEARRTAAPSEAVQGQAAPAEAVRGRPDRATAEVDLAIVTVLPVELRAVQTVFGIDRDRFEVDEHRSRYFFARVPGARAGRDLRLVVTLAEGAHDLGSAHAVDAVLRRHSPAVCFLVGLCAGNRDEFDLADVVVPAAVMNYEAERREYDQSLPRPRYENVPPAVLANLHHYDARRTDFRDKVLAFCAGLTGDDRPAGLDLDRFAPAVKTDSHTIAVGSRLIADGTTLGELRRRDQRITAADQDSYGFARACRGRWWAVFRGVSDFGDPQKSDEWQFVAAGTAALALRDFLETEYVPPPEPAAPPRSAPA